MKHTSEHENKQTNKTKKTKEVLDQNARSFSFEELSIVEVLHLLVSEHNCLLLKHSV